MKKALFYLIVFFHSLKLEYTVFAQQGYFFVSNYQHSQHQEIDYACPIVYLPSHQILLGNSLGLLCFDGKNWSFLDTEPVRAITYDANHVYFSTEKALYSLPHPRQTPIAHISPQKLLDLKINYSQIHLFQNQLFLFSEEQILIYDLTNSTHETIDAQEGNIFSGIFTFRDKLYINVLNLGLAYYKNKTLEPVENGTLLENDFIVDAFTTSDKAFIVTLENSVYAFDGKNFRLVGQYAASKNTSIQQVVYWDGNLFCITDNQGILVINPVNGVIQQQISTVHGLADNFILKACLDPAQGLWLVHPFTISKIFLSKNLQDYSKAVGILGNIATIAEYQNQLWVGSDNGLFLLQQDLPKESEMVTFQVRYTVQRQNKLPFFQKKNKEQNNSKDQNKKTNNNQKQSQEEQSPQKKKNIFSKLKDKFKKKKGDKNQEENTTDEPAPQEETPQPTVQDKKFNYNIQVQERNVTQVNLKTAAAYKKYLVFRPIQGISEYVYTLVPYESNLLVGTQKGIYLLQGQKIIAKLPVFCNSLCFSNGTLWAASNQKVLQLEISPNNLTIKSQKEIGRFIHSVACAYGKIYAGTTKGVAVLPEDLQKVEWLIENQNNLHLAFAQNQLYALSNQQLFAIQNLQAQPIPLNLPKNFLFIPSNQHFVIYDKKSTYKIHLATSPRLDTLNTCKIFSQVPAFAFFHEKEYLVADAKNLFRLLPNKSQQPLQVFFRYVSVNGKSFWGTVFQDSILSEELSLPYGKYNIEIHTSVAPLFSPEKVQLFFQINNGEWTPLNTPEWILYNLPDGTYQFRIKAQLLDLPESEIITFTLTIAKPFWKTIWFYLLLIGLFIAAAYAYARFKTQKLEAEKRKVEQENVILEQKVQERTREIAEQKKVIEEKNEEIMDSLRYSERIQQALLPKEQRLRSLFEDNCFVLYMPRDIVSGDFYWVHELEDKLLIAAGDCTGHGVPGALMSMIGITLLNRIVDKHITQPHLILYELHKEVRETLKQGTENTQVLDGMDIAVVLFEPKNHKLIFSSALRPIFFIRDNEIITYKGDKKSIGGRDPEKHFSFHEFYLEDGDIFYLFSDGYADQFNEQGQKYTLGRFKNKLLEIHQLPLKQQEELLKNEILSWKGNFEQIDDVMVLGIRYSENLN